MLPRSDTKRPQIVAELQDIDNKEIVKLTGGHMTETVVSHDIVSRLLLATSRHPGLAQVYDHLFGFEGNEFYFKEWPQCAGLSFGQIYRSFPKAVPFGFRVACPRTARLYLKEQHDCSDESIDAKYPMLGQFRIMLNPPRDMICHPGDEIIFLAYDDDTFEPVITDANVARGQPHDRLALYAAARATPQAVLHCHLLNLGVV